MPKIKVSFFEIESWERDYLIKNLKEFDLSFSEHKLDISKVKELLRAEVISPFIYSSINSKVLDRFRQLRLVATRSTGFDHIDLAACQQRKISVANVPTYGENTVAEHTFALILALSRKVLPSLERTRRGDFSLDGLRGFDLQGKTIGIVGVGNIGRRMVQIAKGLAMNVLVYDVKPDGKFIKAYGAKSVTLNQLFKKSDIVSLHVPYNKSTHHLINLKTLALFKKGCYLVNTARGGICETAALLAGLKQGIFAGLGLDVLEDECAIREERELLTPTFNTVCDLKVVLGNHILLNQPNVIITPHNAFNSQEALYRILDTTIENIKSFSRGKPINLVD